MRETAGRLDGVRHGALVGLLVGAVAAALGEAGAWWIRETAPMADVGIVGFALVFGVPASIALGALLGWWGRPARATTLALAAAVPAVFVAVGQVVIQALSI